MDLPIIRNLDEFTFIGGFTRGITPFIGAKCNNVAEIRDYDEDDYGENYEENYLKNVDGTDMSSSIPLGDPGCGLSCGVAVYFYNSISVVGCDHKDAAICRGPISEEMSTTNIPVTTFKMAQHEIHTSLEVNQTLEHLNSSWQNFLEYFSEKYDVLSSQHNNTHQLVSNLDDKMSNMHQSYNMSQAFMWTFSLIFFVLIIAISLYFIVFRAKFSDERKSEQMEVHFSKEANEELQHSDTVENFYSEPLISESEDMSIGVTGEIALDDKV